MMKASKQLFSERSVGTLVLSLAGLLIWALHFAIVYGVQHVACAALAANRAAFWVHTTLIVATVAALLALLLAIIRPDIVLPMDRNGRALQHAGTFLLGLMRGLALLSFFGVLWSGAAVLFLPACGSLA
ncbi:conserved membrane hypothetical protein [Candidatus Methylobacter favarea]|uniref:Transmembrane protein n=1 Tax=Candidatus Methylobacter favarea TaxID=2707345 RepID=A0A8S0WQI6_9GAMM|nr:hypothetical protein [Candidatus Methylobacter favarea]CAA9891469.1 conserved membrane hypothetical protein [Candidatus Methylobacter favarea]